MRVGLGCLRGNTRRVDALRLFDRRRDARQLRAAAIGWISSATATGSTIVGGISATDGESLTTTDTGGLSAATAGFDFDVDFAADFGAAAFGAATDFGAAADFGAAVDFAAALGFAGAAAFGAAALRGVAVAFGGGAFAVTAPSARRRVAPSPLRLHVG